MLPDQADRLALEGNLLSAARLYGHQLITFPDGLENRKSLVHLRLACFVWNSTISQRHRRNSIASSNWIKSHIGNWEVKIARIQLLGASGDLRGAVRLAERTIRQASSQWGEVLHHRAEAMLASLWIDHGDYSLARSWAEKTTFEIDAWPRTFRVCRAAESRSLAYC